jgi:hypothetical protein
MGGIDSVGGRHVRAGSGLQAWSPTWPQRTIVCVPARARLLCRAWPGRACTYSEDDSYVLRVWSWPHAGAGNVLFRYCATCGVCLSHTLPHQPFSRICRVGPRVAASCRATSPHSRASRTRPDVRRRRGSSEVRRRRFIAGRGIVFNESFFASSILVFLEIRISLKSCRALS